MGVKHFLFCNDNYGVLYISPTPDPYIGAIQGYSTKIKDSNISSIWRVLH